MKCNTTIRHRRLVIQLIVFQAMAAWLFFIVNNQAYGAGLPIADGGFSGVLEIVEHDVKVTINNGIAITEVTQVFKNTEKRQ